MSEAVRGSDGLALLRATGFQEFPDGSFAVAYNTDESPGNGMPEVTVRVTGINGGPVSELSAGYLASAVYSEPEVKAIEFESGDARDIMAFALAVRSELAAAEGRHNDIPPEDTFESGTFAIHNAFMTGDYYDWHTVYITPVSIRLRDPAENYGEDYLRWRDSRAAQMLADAGLCPAGPAR